MGRKKNKVADEHREDEPLPSRNDSDDSSDVEDYEDDRPRHDIRSDIQQLAYSYNISEARTQELNDTMIDHRERTWEQDMTRLYEILKESRNPDAALRIKIKDMKDGVFVGKAKCGPKVKELAKKHGLDKNATIKLEDAMSIREGLGKDVDHDIFLLDEHLQASNKPSALISQKLESLRKGYPVGSCIYSRATIVGGSGPGVEGVFDKKGGARALGMSDRDLAKRFATQEMESRGGGQLMDEAAVLRMMKADRIREEVETRPKEKKKRGKDRRSSSGARSSPSYERTDRAKKKRPGKQDRRSRSRSVKKRSDRSVSRKRRSDRRSGR